MGVTFSLQKRPRLIFHICLVIKDDWEWPKPNRKQRLSRVVLVAIFCANFVKIAKPIGGKSNWKCKNFHIKSLQIRMFPYIWVIQYHHDYHLLFAWFRNFSHVLKRQLKLLALLHLCISISRRVRPYLSLGFFSVNSICLFVFKLSFRLDFFSQ